VELTVLVLAFDMAVLGVATNAAPVVVPKGVEP